MKCEKCHLPLDWCCCRWTEGNEIELQHRLRECVRDAIEELALSRTVVVHSLLQSAMQVNLGRLLEGADEDTCR